MSRLKYLFLVLLLLPFVASAAPTTQYFSNIAPTVTNTYLNGTASLQWLNLYTRYASTTALSATTICISTDCRTAWPTAGTNYWTSLGNGIFNNTGQSIGVNVQSQIAALEAMATTTTGPGLAIWNSTGGPDLYTINGKVGIGTTTPASTFTIQQGANTTLGGLTLFNAAGTAKGTINVGATGGFAFNSDADSFAFNTNGVNFTMNTSAFLTSDNVRALGASGNRWSSLFVAGTVRLGSGTTGSALADASGVLTINGGTSGTGNALLNPTGTGLVGVGTSTPWGRLSINPIAGSGPVPAFVVGSSSGTSLLVANNGNVGIGTTTPGSLLAIQGIANFTTATSTFSSTGGINLASGCYAIAGVCVTGSGGGTPGGLNLQVQYNNAGVFGGISGAVTNGTVLNLTNPIIGGATLTTSSVNGVTLTAVGSATSYLNGTGAYSVPVGTTYTATYPVTLTGNAFGLAFGTTTTNTWSAMNTFTPGITLGGVASPTYAQGKLVYDTDNESLTFTNNDSNVSLQIGQEEWTRVKNVTGSTIANGAAVYINGTSAGLPTIDLATGLDSTKIIGLGLTTESIANNAIGYVTTIGVVHGLNTSAFVAGTAVYVSTSTPGGLTSVSPVSPYYRYRIGIVTVSDASIGAIHVTPSTAALGNGSYGQLLSINTLGKQVFISTSTLGIAISDTTGTLGVSRGGTGNTTFTSSQLLYGNGTNALSSVGTSTIGNGGGLSVTGSGSLVGGSGISIALNLTNPNTWTGLQQFNGGATTTNLTVTGTASSSRYIAGFGGSVPVYTFSGNEASGIYEPNSTTIKIIGTGGASVADFESSPSQLTMYGDVRSFNAGSFRVRGLAGALATPTYEFVSDTDTGVWNPYANALSFVGGATELIRSDVASTSIVVGNFGVGTTSPGTKLSVQGVANFGTATSTFQSTGGINLTAGCYAINNICVGTGAGTVTSVNVVNGGGLTSTGGPITSSGNITLSLNTGNANTWTSLQNFNGATPATAASIGSSTPWGLFSINPTAAINAAPAFAIGSSSATSFMVNNIGLVGIGTTSPSAYLSINSTADQKPSIMVGSSTGTNFSVTPSTSSLLGIGSSSPTRPLSVTGGTINVNGLLASVSGLTVVCFNSATFDFYAGISGTTCSASSITKKEDVSTSTAGIDELMQLRAVQFYFKDRATGGDKQQQLGLIAEEVNLIDPRLVEHNATSSAVTGLRIDNFVGLFVKSIQDVTHHQNESDERIAALEEEVAALQSGNQVNICRVR